MRLIPAPRSPPLPRELEGGGFVNSVKVEDDQSVLISENLAAAEENGWAAAGPYSTHSFSFDHVYDQHCDQKKVYETTAKAVVESSLKGYNATIFAYGQTGTGKTYTMVREPAPPAACRQRGFADACR